MTDALSSAAAPRAATLEERVLEVVRALAAEAGGGRAARAVTPAASLERDLGLGSLERVELLLRLERAFGRKLADEALSLDTPAALARALLAGGAASAPAAEGRAPGGAIGAAVPLAA
ncbi:MAG TPA: phosphopantetheine-binding protein, partial [Vicinamibacteria bacterium]